MRIRAAASGHGWRKGGRKRGGGNHHRFRFHVWWNKATCSSSKTPCEIKVEERNEGGRGRYLIVEGIQGGWDWRRSRGSIDQNRFQAALGSNHSLPVSLNTLGNGSMREKSKVRCRRWKEKRTTHTGAERYSAVLLPVASVRLQSHSNQRSKFFWAIYFCFVRKIIKNCHRAEFAFDSPFRGKQRWLYHYNTRLYLWVILGSRSQVKRTIIRTFQNSCSKQVNCPLRKEIFLVPFRLYLKKSSHQQRIWDDGEAEIHIGLKCWTLDVYGWPIILAKPAIRENSCWNCRNEKPRQYAFISWGGDLLSFDRFTV